MATISGEDLLAASPTDRSQLKDVHELLTRLFIRNRNQHRRNHWFGALHQFRKQLALLLEDMDSTRKTAAAKAIAQRLHFWDDKCIHQWYLRFTQLIAAGPFAVLGLVLMASVARVCRITGITGLYEEIASDDMKNVLSAVDDGQFANEFGGIAYQDQTLTWDEGEVVAREDDQNDDDDDE